MRGNWVKFDVRLSGSPAQVRQELEELGRRDARNVGRRALAGAGSVACLVVAFGWGVLELPGLLVARLGLAVLLTVCTVAIIRLTPKDLDAAVMADLCRLLYLLRRTPSLEKVSLNTDLTSTVAKRRLELCLGGAGALLEGFVSAARAFPHEDLETCALENGMLKVAFVHSCGQSNGREFGAWVDWFMERWNQGNT